MLSIIPLGRHAELENSRHAITLSTGKRLVLFRLPALPSINDLPAPASSIGGWTYYAMEKECPHAGGPMGDAQIDIEDSSYIASCPWHAYDFNLDTGSSSFGVKACVFPITVREDQLMLEFDGEEGVGLARIEPISEKVKYKHNARTPTSTDAINGIATTNTTSSPPGEDATVCDWCVHILNTSDPEQKINLTTHLFSTFATREQTDNPMPIGAGTVQPPDEPPRQDLTQVQPWQTLNPGRGGTLKSRINMLHALANIEQWAIDLAIDICVRFATFHTEPSPTTTATSQPLPRTFFHDWLKVANDEAKHFSLLRTRLENLSSSFGALPVHHGLWDSARHTSHDLRARISVIALVHEARGLDVNPSKIAKFRKAGDTESVETLEIIHQDEITHVTTGHRWLSWICEREGKDAVEVFRGAVRECFRGPVKGPFNVEARGEAGLDGRFYEGLIGGLPGRGGHVVAGG
ncbi:hypothetical protein B0A50_02424 [Salinomyces thailandicus]|uniref:Rieske domain-containing protein n=1 Tax=Salinomyces thailandicus TaxID=706561 RepID=A0A4U0U6T8_9PEZI|nr:hypothetical protein B0A50_02424 [Salinomyces thailandica]